MPQWRSGWWKDGQMDKWWVEATFSSEEFKIGGPQKQEPTRMVWLWICLHNDCTVAWQAWKPAGSPSAVWKHVVHQYPCLSCLICQLFLGPLLLPFPLVFTSCFPLSSHPNCPPNIVQSLQPQQISALNTPQIPWYPPVEKSVSMLEFLN